MVRAIGRYPLLKDGRRASSGRLLGICQHRTRTADEMCFGERGVAVEFCILVAGGLVRIVGQLEGQVPMVSIVDDQSDLAVYGCRGAQIQCKRKDLIWSMPTFAVAKGSAVT